MGKLRGKANGKPPCFNRIGVVDLTQGGEPGLGGDNGRLLEVNEEQKPVAPKERQNKLLRAAFGSGLPFHDTHVIHNSRQGERLPSVAFKEGRMDPKSVRAHPRHTPMTKQVPEKSNAEVVGAIHEGRKGGGFRRSIVIDRALHNRYGLVFNKRHENAFVLSVEAH